MHSHDTMLDCIQDDVEEVVKLQYNLNYVSMSIYWPTIVTQSSKPNELIFCIQWVTLYSAETKI